MTPGHIVNNQCVDVAASQAAYWSTMRPTTIVSGIDTYYTYTQYSAPDWYLFTFKNGVYQRYTTLATPAFPSCDTTENFFDGLQMGWGVATIMIIVYVIRRPYR